jgi:hypothetical protein
MYIAGFNLAGCVSDPDSNYITDNWSDAVTYLVDTLEAWWYADYAIAEWEEDSGVNSTAKQEVDSRYLDMHTVLHNNPQPPHFSAIMQDYADSNWEMWIVEAEGDFEEEME